MDFDSRKSHPTEPIAASSPASPGHIGRGKLLKETTSICPKCLQQLPARVYQRAREVWMDKQCEQHGRFSALLSSSIDHYYRAAPRSDQDSPCCGSSCGVPSVAASGTQDTAAWTNHSCTILIEITERCNLSCPTCFAGSSPAHSNMMSMEEFTRQVDQLVAGGKSGSDMIQLSGGEPTIHPDFLEMVELLFDRGFKQVCINSNGIKLAKPAFVERLAKCRGGKADCQLFVYLQFDGFEDETYSALRGRGDLLSSKRKTLENCQAHGISVHPVMTLTRGVNAHEVGSFVQLAVDRPELKNVVIQPAMYSGRYDNPRRQDRITLADTVDLICDQFGVFSPEDFMPIPCSDPNCFGMAVALRTGQGLLPVSRLFPGYETWNSEEAKDLIAKFTDTINGPAAVSEAVRWATSDNRLDEVLQNLDEEEIEGLLDAMMETHASGKNLWDRVLTISIKPFMDAWTYDQDRIDRCCVHILDKDGNPVSFCEFNAINRPRLEQTAGVTGAAPIKVIDA
jgi:uncharacterized radical SAM superfamily Fe-S cluster-containing enzyme